MKKFLSSILAVVMVLSSMATVAFAADSDYAEGYFYVKGVYDTPYTEIGDAVSAAGADGTVIVSGTIAFNSRRAVSTDITLEGVNDATIVPTTSFGSTTSTTNWKALLNLNGNITVKNITFDGSEYGDDITASTDFVPLRCAEGNITLENVTIKGSPRSLMLVGSSSTSATVTANGLYCDAPVKTIDDNTYADVNVVNGTLYLNSGEVNGLICTDDNWSGLTHYVGNLQTAANGCHFKLDCSYTVEYELFGKTYTRVVTDDVTSTVEHFVATYEGSKNLASTYKEDFLKTMTDSDNTDAVADMVDWAELNASSELKTSFGELLLDAAGYAGEGSTLATTFTNYASRLGVKEAE